MLAVAYAVLLFWVMMAPLLLIVHDGLGAN
jgi:hypothetical protein